MEQAPLSPISAETNPDKSDNPDKKNSKKKKRSEALGSFAIEPSTTPEKIGAEKPASIWQRLTGEKAEPLQPERLANESTDAQETAGETELAQLEPAEQNYVVRELTKAKLAEDQPQLGDETAAEHQAVESFREKIVSEALDSDAALQQTLAELGDEPEDEQPHSPDLQPELPPQPAESLPTSDAATEQNGAAAAGGSGSIGGGSRPPISFAQSPQPGDPNSYYPRHNRAGDVLIGGIVGYLIGRRRGRIKAEKRLLPVQKKLEKQVLQLEQEVSQKEAVIRQAVRQKRGSQAAIGEQAQRKRPERQAAVSANLLHSAVAPEHIGRMIVKAENPELRKPAVAPPSPTPEKLTNITKHVETLTRNELLAVSATISVEGSTLRQIYETHLVSERGLRRLVAEHLRGGNLQKALRREVLEREIDFERDPAMRDQPSVSASSATASNLQAMLENATKQLPGGSGAESEAVLKARAAHEQVVRQQSQRNQQLATASLTTIIAILVAIVLYMLLTRR